ncbi:MBL fold metallo-hydrolase [Hymenobacter crusticola]|uniref:MBL fold metallo-hydrolase n=1 Tax=Hymenobacter crusticola TaxID=1770526 RepID=A0A243WHU4_9BACT|nr:MBL fold metallo-hydrolase [Hymenobacter crusticola]OUJ75387.1 MBL fold metallo-hydrolase [Hymenobacter crusticola]
MQTPSRFNGKKYLNTIATSVSPPNGYSRMLQRWLMGKEIRTPQQQLGPFAVDVAALAEPVPASALRVTWLGHSSVLLEIDGKRFLTDPVWSRASPVGFAGPKRFFAMPLPLTSLPALDGIIISHDHYDHLDEAAVRAFARTNVPFYCPLGVGAHLRRWGVAASRVTELDWWQHIEVGGTHTLVATPARHFSGRGMLDRDSTLWASWVVLGPQHRAFFGGDSGPFEAGFREIGAAYGPFDLTMLEVGAYDENWADIHMGPDHAAAAHQALRGRLLLPLHWGTFNLAFHSWTEPIERLQTIAAAQHLALLLPQPGQRVDARSGAANSRWWHEQSTL